VLTCVAALEAMGRDGHFETAFELSGAGDLVARAGGDPLYRADSDGALDPWLDDLAAQLRAAGVTRVAGALVLDEGTFLEPGPGPGWPSREQHWADYCGLSAGFSANAGCLTATVTPGAAGGPATTIVRPRDHGLARKGQVTTGARGSRNAVNVGANRAGVTVRGTLPAGVQPFVCRFAHPDPVELFGHAVSEGLRRRGVPVAGGIRRERGAEGGRRVALLRSPIAPLLEPILLDSENPVADQLLLAAAVRAGLSGDRAGGQALVRRALEGLDVPSDGLVLVDGSGLSRDDRVAAHHFTATMVALRGHQGWPALLAALPVAGETGSLANRMRTAPARGRVHAKTGFIGGTSALVGVTRTLDGRELAFAVLVNYPVVSGLNTSCWKPMGDELAGLLVESEDPR